MELETIRINLPCGDYAIVYKDVLRKTARLHEAALRKYMTPVNDASKVLLSELKDNQELGAIDYAVDFISLDADKDKISEIFILNQTIEWSFGPVNIEVLDNKVTREQYKKLVEEFDRLYKPIPLPEND